ncbi:antirepressor protein ant [Roseobacter sp. MED193]|uniref:BRO-N domain-containing protein n=1 Tax=Roseobacter sp. MED193 TaxID=314262 RepID=UPI000068B9F4|nr:BRO family protein [Roseobacter sp. MED193]EAQ47716.1 antirepressor protein ant [Roseobacter sp. MED193]
MIDIDGEPWFVATDVCRALSLQIQPTGKVNVTAATRNLAGDERGLLSIHTPIPTKESHTTKMVCLSEGGLYKLIMRCDKAEVHDFQEWVTRVVLPAIRKDGGYVMGEEKVVTCELSEDELVARAIARGLGSTIKLSATIEDNQQAFGVTAPA